MNLYLFVEFGKQIYLLPHLLTHLIKFLNMYKHAFYDLDIMHYTVYTYIQNIKQLNHLRNLE